MSLLFDMDGLLLDTERVAHAAFDEVVENRGLVVCDDLFLSLVGSNGVQSRARLSDEFGPGVDIAAFDQDWKDAFNKRIEVHVPVKPGVKDAIGALAAKATPMIVVTTTWTEHAKRELEQAGLLCFFKDVVGGDVVAENKPHPAPYLVGASLLGHDPRDCFAFEDSDKGVASAVAAGCRVSQIPDLRPMGVPLPKLGQGVYPDLTTALRDTGWL